MVRKRRAEKRAETPDRDSWADPDGVGRCRRCALYLVREDTVEFTVRRRSAGPDALTFGLCLACAELVLSAWHLGGRL